MINFENYSKSRFLISFIFGVVFLYLGSQTITSYITFNANPDIQFGVCNPCKSGMQIFKEYLQTFLLVAGMVLFTLNKRLTDYISVTIFVFLSGLLSVKFVNGECFTLEYFNSCTKSYILVFLFFLLPIIFLTINFIKNIGKE